MNIKDLEGFEEYFNVIKEPDFSREILNEFESLYPNLSSRMIYWLTIIQGFDSNSLSGVIPEIHDWIYHIEKYLQYGGTLTDGDDFDNTLENDDFDVAEDSFSFNNSKYNITKEENLNSPLFYFFL